VGGTLGVGHQADHVAALVAHAGDVVGRPVWVVDVAEHDPVLGSKHGERVGFGGVVALEVVDRDRQAAPHLKPLRERSVRRSHLQCAGSAHELQLGVLLERTGQQAGLAQHLEAVADADDRTTGLGQRSHCGHDR
jgi:hypothetical protein